MNWTTANILFFMAIITWYGSKFSFMLGDVEILSLETYLLRRFFIKSNKNNIKQ